MDEKDSWEYINTNLPDKMWRINNLYKLADEGANKVTFRLRPVQEDFVKQCLLHPRVIVLKSRQHGVSTASLIAFGLDEALFNENFRYNVTAHTLDDAKMLLDTKIAFPYDNLHPELKKRIPLRGNAKTVGKEKCEFANGSVIYVDTAVRSGNVQSLHVSELGKIALKDPLRAKEIIAGSFNAIPVGGRIIVESTAEGPNGTFYEMCAKAQTLKRMIDNGESALTSADFKFLFYPWFMDTVKNVMTDDDVDKIELPSETEHYFDELAMYWENYDVDAYNNFFPLSDNQKCWYFKKAEEQGSDIFKEQASTPEEAFKQSVEGAYYAQQFFDLEKAGRISNEVTYFKGKPVHTAWDIGYNDETAIWFYQHGPANNIHIIDFYQNSGENVEYYIRKLREKEYNYGYHYGPHDLMQKNFATGKSTFEVALSFGLQFVVLPMLKKRDGIQEVRRVLSSCYFNKRNCATGNPLAKGAGKHSGVDLLKMYRKQYSEHKGIYLDEPMHDFTSHASDAMRYLCQSVSYKHGGGRRREVQKNWRAF